MRCFWEVRWLWLRLVNIAVHIRLKLWFTRCYCSCTVSCKQYFQSMHHPFRKYWDNTRWNFLVERPRFLYPVLTGQHSETAFTFITKSPLLVAGRFAGPQCLGPAEYRKIIANITICSGPIPCKLPVHIMHLSYEACPVRKNFVQNTRNLTRKQRRVVVPEWLL